MNKYEIAVIAGDGIGPEVISQGKRILNRAAEMDGGFTFSYTDFPWGCEYYLRNGRMMAEDALSQLKSFDAIYLGAVGYPGVPDHISLRDLLLTIRQGFEQYVNLRPVKLLRGAPCPLLKAKPEDIQMLSVRENSEGEYSGSGAWLYKNTPRETVIQNSVFSREGCERIIRYAFNIAEREGKSVTNVSKANALNYSMVFWDQVFEEISEEFPNVTTHHYLADAASMLMVKDPSRFEIVVTTNLFGDILTDLGAAIAGGMGLAAGANLNPERKYPSMFEPIHGSAPDIAGKNTANPMASIWAAAMMLEHFGMKEWSDRIITAMEKTLIEKNTLTPDLGGTGTTIQLTDAIMRNLEEVK